MLLRAQAVGKEPCVRFVILKLDEDECKFWNGIEFTQDIETSLKYWRPSDACFDMQDILKEHYGHLPKRKFVVPIEIEVFGNGPNESYVAPVVH